MDLATVIALVTLVLAVAGSLFAVYLNLSAKIDRTYIRMDENKEQYYDDFLLKSSHEEALKYTKELHDQKHDGLQTLVKEKLENLANEVKQLREIIKNKQ